MSVLKIYRSSAGSGKTHTLVSAYLKLALNNPEDFAQILAVTFTNRATQEMKERILAYLQDLVQDTAGPLAQELMQEKGWDKATLQGRAQAVLSNILHQYTRFSVSTIDSFFQKIVRGFAQELGLQYGFSIELDQAHVMQTIVHDLIAAAGQDQQLRQWLVELAEDKLLSGKAWNFEKELTELGQVLFTEAFRTHEAQLAAAASDPKAIRQWVQQLYQHTTYFETQLQAWGKQAEEAMHQAGLQVTDFAYGKTGVAGYLTGLVTLKRVEPTQRALRALQHLEAWYSKTSPEQQRIAQLAQQTLQPILQQVVHFYQTHHRTYYTAGAVRHFIYAFGIVTQLLERLNDYRAAHNVMLVSDASLFLRKIIAENDTPFIYEKIGAFYKHFLIDEFQDVSGFQWHNFKPLIANSLTEGHMSLVVGDIKQSIYRWRGSDWRLLLTQIQQDIVGTASVALNQNWRSKQHIVDFNNAFFAIAATGLVQHLEVDLQTLEDTVLKKDLLAQVRQLSAAYQDVHQHLPAQRAQHDPGYVKITFLEEEEAKDADDAPVGWREQVLARLPLLIEKLQKEGFALKDIALLVRNNAEGRAIFQTLLAHQQSPKAQLGCRYDAIASTSLYLSHSPWVSLIINALKCLAPAEDLLAQAELVHLYWQYVLQEATPSFHTDRWDEKALALLPEAFVAQRLELQQLPLYALVDALINIFQLHKAEAGPFLQAFQDIVLGFAEKDLASISHFLAWWEERGHQYALPRVEGQDAMPIMTIHQAKGLQFKVVIVPFCAWDLDHQLRQPPTLWCHTDEPPFDTFPVLPLRYASRLKDTVYAQAYYEERMQAHLDHLNLLYVALTRPEERLYVFAPRPSKALLKTTADLLYQTLEQASSSMDSPNVHHAWADGWNASAGTLEMGQAAPKTSSPNKLSSLPAYTIAYGASQAMALQSFLASLEPSSASTPQAQYGRLVHRLLAQLPSLDALPALLEDFQQAEALSQVVVNQIQEQLTKLLDQPQVKDWFSGTWEVKREATLLAPSGQVMRPDRVMLQSGQAVVIDFKTGVLRDHHRQQVQAYAQALSAMGYAQVKAYLLYTETAAVVAC